MLIDKLFTYSNLRSDQTLRFSQTADSQYDVYGRRMFVILVYDEWRRSGSTICLHTTTEQGTSTPFCRRGKQREQMVLQGAGTRYTPNRSG